MSEQKPSEETLHSCLQSHKEQTNVSHLAAGRLSTCQVYKSWVPLWSLGKAASHESSSFWSARMFFTCLTGSDASTTPRLPGWPPPSHLRGSFYLDSHLKFQPLLVTPFVASVVGGIRISEGNHYLSKAVTHFSTCPFRRGNHARCVGR